MLAGARVFVVVPAYREAARLPRVIETMPECVDTIIVVDDASDDGTFERARGSTDARVVALRHTTNRGVGAAIATGYRHALALPGSAHDAFVVMAGDGQMDPRDLPALVTPIARGEAGYVKGNRFAWREDEHAARTSMPRARFLGGHVMSALTRAAIALPIHDSQCGYTAIAREACAHIDLADLWPRFGYPNDLLAKLALVRIPIAEVPIRAVYTHRKNKLGARHVPVIAAITLRAWLRRLREG